MYELFVWLPDYWCYFSSSKDEIDHVHCIIFHVCTHGCEYVMATLTVQKQNSTCCVMRCTLEYSDRDLTASSDMEGIGAGRNTFPVCFHTSVQDVDNTIAY